MNGTETDVRLGFVVAPVACANSGGLAYNAEITPTVESNRGRAGRLMAEAYYGFGVARWRCHKLRPES